MITKPLLLILLSLYLSPLDAALNDEVKPQGVSIGAPCTTMTDVEEATCTPYNLVIDKRTGLLINKGVSNALPRQHYRIHW